jgi:transcriptional regulator GlxA family with amidase domain
MHHQAQPDEPEEVRIVLVAFDDYTDVDLILMWDLLKRVTLPHWNVRIVGDAPVLRSMTGLTVAAHGAIEEANDAHAVFFTSGKGNRVKIRDREYLARFRLDPERQRIGSICSGALLLGALGLLRGRCATTYPSAKTELERYGVTVLEEPFVEQGNIATAAGCLAATYLAHWFIEGLAGQEAAEFVIASAQPVGRGLYYEKAESEQAAE